MWEATSNFLQVDAVFASVVRLAGSFHNYNDVVENICQVNLGEGGSSDVTNRRRGVESCNQLSVFRTTVNDVLSWLEFLFVLMLGIMKSSRRLEISNDSKILAVKPNNRKQEDQIFGCFLVETNKLRQEEAQASV